MAIRSAIPDDAERISILITELSEKFIIGEFSLEGKNALMKTLSPGAVRKFMEAGFKYHVDERESQIVGVVGVKNNGHLYHLFVSEKFHGQGIARKLWQLAMEECLLSGNPGEFTVNSSLYAVGCYEKLGFITGSRPVKKDGVIFVPMKYNVHSRH